MRLIESHDGLKEFLLQRENVDAAVAEGKFMKEQGGYIKKGTWKLRPGDEDDDQDIEELAEDQDVNEFMEEGTGV